MGALDLGARAEVCEDCGHCGGRGIRLEAELGDARVRCQGHHRQLAQIVGPELDLSASPLGDLDEHAIVRGGRSRRNAVEHVAAADAAHEAERRLYRHDLAREASKFARRRAPVTLESIGSLVRESNKPILLENAKQPGRGGLELAEPALGQAVRPRIGVDEDAEELDARCGLEDGLVHVRGEAERLDHAQHALRVDPRSVRAEGEAKVVDVHDACRREARLAHDVRCHRTKTTEGTRGGAQAEGQDAEDIQGPPELEAKVLPVRRVLNQLTREGVKEVGVEGKANGEEDFHLVKNIFSFLLLLLLSLCDYCEERVYVLIRVVKKPTWGWLPLATCARSFSI